MIKNKTYIGRKDLCQAIAKKTKFTQDEVHQVLEALISTISEVIGRGGSIILKGFLSISSKKKPARKGFIPHMGNVDIPPKTIVKIRSLMDVSKDKDEEE